MEIRQDGRDPKRRRGKQKLFVLYTESVLCFMSACLGWTVPGTGDWFLQVCLQLQLQLESGQNMGIMKSWWKLFSLGSSPCGAFWFHRMSETQDGSGNWTVTVYRRRLGFSCGNGSLCLNSPQFNRPRCPPCCFRVDQSDEHSSWHSPISTASVLVSTVLLYTILESGGAVAQTESSISVLPCYFVWCSFIPAPILSCHFKFSLMRFTLRSSPIVVYSYVSYILLQSPTLCSFLLFS